MSKKLNYEYCRAAPVLEWMGQKWALVTLLRMKEASEAAAQGGEIRFSQATFPPHVAYSLTPLAHNFLREISYVIEWGQLHYEEILQGRKAPHVR